MTDTLTTTPADDPAAIEADIRRTQDEMSKTVDKIGDQLNPRTFINALLDKAESNDIDARYLIDGARRNPLALGMIAGGLIWLVSDSDAKLPSLNGIGSSLKGSGSQDKASDRPEDFGDRYHRDYVAHMERVQRAQDEDDLAYQRRRDLARSNYFMLERGHDEDEGSFRQRLDAITESFRQKRHDWADSARSAGSSAADTASQAAATARETAQTAATRARQAYASNPLIGGLIAAAVGAIAGTALPLTQTEEDKLGDLGETARETLGEQKDRLVSAAREKKDELIDKIEEQGHAEPGQTGGAQRQPAQLQTPQFANANDSGGARQLAAEDRSGQSGSGTGWPADDQQG